MTLKDIAKQLTTAVQTVPNLVQILRDGLEQAETGEDVVVTQTLESGTEIASIKVGDDDAVKLYAPESSTVYTIGDKKIGKWIDNKDLYELIIEIENATVTTQNYDTYTSVDLEAYHIGEVVQAVGMWKRKISESGAFTAPIGYYEAVSGGALVKGTIRFNTANNLQYCFIVSSGQTVPYAQIRINYTKATT